MKATGRGLAAGAMTAGLRPVASVFGAVAALRRRAYGRGWLVSHGVGVPVVSVGSVSCGGSGKTPVAGYIGAWLTERGCRVGLVCSGYRGRAGGRVLRVCADEDGAGVWYGDEAAMLARQHAGTIVVRGPDKLGAAALAARLGAGVVVVDDGFQHLRLRRGLDVVVCGPEDGLPLPAGPGRESLSALAHADLVWWHDRSGVADLGPLAAEDLARGVHAPLEAPSRWWPAGVRPDVVSRYEVTGLLDGGGQTLGPATMLKGSRVCLLAAVARPQALARLVTAQGAEVVASLFLRDHARFQRKQLRQVADSGVDWVVCTEKDLARDGEALRLCFADRLAVLACRVRVVWGCESFEGRLKQALKIA